ncbi:unnamed protein product [Darwinula stevensoni]|uniref:Uncharacterized protein n=1 Tax=Darwinula stevensoni TaxID=69355 RepID=A0A7R8X1A2_9CRUS|nr:unnamed protein product [Darwinula stevensoni]CAG0879748.1 unnamed protein product [Darwinula stevensoni]
MSRGPESTVMELQPLEKKGPKASRPSTLDPIPQTPNTSAESVKVQSGESGVPEVMVSSGGVLSTASATASTSRITGKRAFFKRSKTSHTLLGGKGGTSTLFSVQEPRIFAGRFLTGKLLSPQKSKSVATESGAKGKGESVRSPPAHVASSSGSSGSMRYLVQRRSSYQVELDLEPSAVSSFIAPLKLPQPIQAPQIPKRRCSLTLPYPCLYGSWQFAGRQSNSGEIPSNSSQGKSQVSLAESVSTHSDTGMIGVTRTHSGKKNSTSGPGNNNGSSPITALPLSPGSFGNSHRGHREITLVAQNFQRIPMKDFAAEVRASRDVTKFLNQAVLFMDVNENNMDSIVDLMLCKILDADEPTVSIEEAKSVLFTHDSGLPSSSHFAFLALYSSASKAQKICWLKFFF